MTVEADITVDAGADICDLPASKAKSAAVTDDIVQGIVLTLPEAKNSTDLVEDTEKDTEDNDIENLPSAAAADAVTSVVLEREIWPDSPWLLLF